MGIIIPKESDEKQTPSDFGDNIAVLQKLDGKGNRMTGGERRMAELLPCLSKTSRRTTTHSRPPARSKYSNEWRLANNLKQKDLLDAFGTPSIASEVLSGKRRLNTEPIR